MINFMKIEFSLSAVHDYHEPFLQTYPIVHQMYRGKLSVHEHAMDFLSRMYKLGRIGEQTNKLRDFLIDNHIRLQDMLRK